MKLRSQKWFDNPDNSGMTALYIERYLNYGLTREELQSGKPMIGIAQTGNDLSPAVPDQYLKAIGYKGFRKRSRSAIRKLFL